MGATGSSDGGSGSPTGGTNSTTSDAGSTTTDGSTGTTDPNSNPPTPVTPVIFYNSPSDGSSGPVPIDWLAGAAHPSSLGNAPSFTSFAQTRNQIAIASRMDSLQNGASGNIAPLFASVQGLSSPDTQHLALASLSGEVYGTVQTLGLQMGDHALRVISNRIINNDLFLNDDRGIELTHSVDPNQTATRGMPRVAEPCA